MLGIHLEVKNSTKTFLSYQWIVDNSDISINSIENWAKRNIGERIYKDGRAYIEYDSIPVPSRKKLPTKEAIRKLWNDYHNADGARRNAERCYQELYKAYQLDWMQYRQLYEDRGFDIEKATEYAKQHAVWQQILVCRFSKSNEYKPQAIHEAYKRIYPKGYAYAGMSRAYKTCLESGIPALLIKEYVKGNDYAKQFGDWHVAFVIRWMSSGKAYNAVKIHDELAKECRASDKKIPSYTWVKYCIADYKDSVGEGRYGKDAWNAKNAPYAGIIKALNPNSQWQMDGWRLPFYMQGFETLTLYGVMDAHSGFLIDYDVAPTENTENILRAMSRAVEATQCLPFEIVTDNHSFNQTKEADYLKAHTDKLGMTWTVDSNPRRKGVIERSLGVFGDKFMKEFPGYIGQGIKTKDPNGRTSQEEMDKYTRSGMWRTADEIRIYAQLCVDAYNAYVAEKDKGKKKSRAELFANPDQPHKIPVSYEDRLRLFIRESEYKVQRGQINIKRDLQLHEYQLNSELIAKYNGKQLRVRYESFDEIYLFDIDTDECLGSVKAKRMAHGALADQTEEDIKILNQHTGRLKGVKNQLNKKQEKVLKNIDPEAAYCVNPMIGKKIDIEELERNGKLNEALLRHGVDLRFVAQPKVLSEDNSYKPKEKKTKRDQPFASKEKGVKTFKLSEMKEEISETSQPLRKVITPNVDTERI